MGQYFQYEREEDKRNRYEEYRLINWNQPKKASECGCNSFPTIEAVEDREGMTNNRSGEHKSKCNVRAWCCIRVCTKRKEQSDRNYTLKNIAKKCEETTPESSICKGVRCTWIMVFSFFDYVSFTEYFCPDLSKEYTAAEIADDNKRQYCQQEYKITSF